MDVLLKSRHFQSLHTLFVHFETFLLKMMHRFRLFFAQKRCIILSSYKTVKKFSDRAFDIDKIFDYIASKFTVAVIPSKKNRKVCREYDRAVYKNRNQIERFFNRLKQFRRIATSFGNILFCKSEKVEIEHTFIRIKQRFSLENDVFIFYTQK